MMINQECIISCPSRLVYTLKPLSLVYVGPNIDKALGDLVEALIVAFNNKGIKARHIATTYSLANIAILIDCFEHREDIHLRFLRLHFRNGCFSRSEFENEGLSHRITSQLQNIQKYRPDLMSPFRCVEDWRGIGPKDHPIYDRMVEASSSIEDWRVFMDNVCASLLIILYIC
jgi:hypothetical protein